MDPLSALGAAAASAQFVGYAVQGALGIHKIWREMKDAPAGIEELLNHVQGEITSFSRLIDAKSPLAYQLSNEQRKHLAPFATDAAGAIIRMESILRPLATELDQLKGQHGLQKRFQRSWAKIMTMKTLKDIRANLEVVERLNRTLSRELEISGLITQSSLLDQNSQIILTTSSMSTRLDMANRSIQDVQSSQLRAESILAEKLGVLEQGSTSSAQLLNLIHNELVLQRSRPHSQTITDRHSNTISSLTTSRLEDSHSISSSSYKPLICACRRRPTHKEKLMRSPRDHRQTRLCPLHGPVRTWGYHATANLSPFVNGALELTLGFLTTRRGFSVLPPLHYHATVKRSESHLFEWFDGIQSVLRQRALMMRQEGLRSRKLQWYPLPSRQLARVTERMSYLVEGIRRSVALGLASGSDSDENGRTLLFEIFWLLVLLGPERSHVTKEIIELLRLASVSDVDIGATTDICTWTEFTPGKLTVPTAFLFHEFRLYDLNQEIYREFVNFDSLLDPNTSPTSNHTTREFLELLLDNPDIAEAAGYPDFSMAILRRSLPDTMRLAQQAKGDVQHNTNFWGPELALGWPEGLRFLVEEGFNVQRGLQMAAELGDTESAEILLTTKRPLVSPHDNSSFHNSRHEWLIAVLAETGNDDVFQMYVEEVWRRGYELQTLALPHFEEDEIDEMTLDEISSWMGNSRAVQLLSQRMSIPPYLGEALTALPHYILAFTVGNERARIHQTLHEIGWVDVDAGYEYGRTPLIELCRHFVADLYGENLQNWLGLILWFIEKGANPYFPASEEKRLFWPHLQFYLAAAYPAVSSVKSRITRRLRSKILESCDAPVVSDGCKCFCSTKGCIAPSLLWRCQPLGHDSNHANCIHLDRRKWLGLRDWVTAWKLPKIERQRSYREICRLEVFERLGARHTCCATYGRIAWDVQDEEIDLAEELYQSSDEIAEIRDEDRPLAEQVHLTMFWYGQLHKVLCFMPLHVFWKMWWAMADHVLLALRAEEACRFPRWTVDRSCYVEGRRWAKEYPLIKDQTEERKKKITQNREDRWAEELEGAGYGKWDLKDAIEGNGDGKWGFTDVMNHHFTMCWLRARAHRGRVLSRKRHRLVGKPKFIVKKNKSPAANAESGWRTESDGE